MRRLAIAIGCAAGVAGCGASPSRAPVPSRGPVVEQHPLFARPTVSLPDSEGIPTIALAEATSPSGELWVGTYGRGIFVRSKAGSWRRIVSDTSGTSLSMDFIHAIAFDAAGTAWVGTIGNGWGRSTDGGRSWKNWTFTQLGPEWQYVAPNGIVVRGDTVAIATADGLQLSSDGGEHWLAVVDGTGPVAKGPADTAIVALQNEYVRWIEVSGGRLRVGTLGAVEELDLAACFARARCAVQRFADQHPTSFAGAVRTSSSEAPPPRGWLPWFGRPISADGNEHIDQTYRWGSTMGGFFQPHQGIEFNNPDGTAVHAIGNGTVVHAGRAERGALTVAIRHDRKLPVGNDSFFVFSVYYHNSALRTSVGARVARGDVIALVGHTGRATNDHLHLEVHAAPTDSVRLIVDSLNRFPPFTTNPELWIAPLPGTGVIAGTVVDAAGKPLPQARVYGIAKPFPYETPFVFAETYGPRNRPHPVYGEHFAVSDVPEGTHDVWVMIDGRQIRRRIVVSPGLMTWVEFRP